MPTVCLSPITNGYQFLSAAGVPLSGGLLSTYAAGTSTPKLTYTTSAGNVANPLTITLNADGRLPDEVWLISGSSYKFILTDALGNPIDTYDNIGGIVDSAVLAASGGSARVGFIQSGTGAVARTAQDKMREVVSSADFNNTKGTNSIGLGTSVLSSQTGGDQNTVVGYQAGKAIVNASYNCYFGGNCGVAATGSNSSGYGQNCLAANTADGNSAFGCDAASSNTTGTANSVFGTEGLHTNTIGSSNSVFGNAALRLLLDGSNNSAFGDQALAAQTTGNANSVFGQGAGIAVTTGQQNTLLGKSAGSTLTTGSNVICIGYNVQPSTATTSNEATIGDTNITLTRLRGSVQATTTSAFMAQPSAQAANATGDNTVYTIVCATESFDQAGDFDGVSTFTCRTSGKHRFEVIIALSGIAAHNALVVNLVTTAASYTLLQVNPGNVAANGGLLNLSASILVSMTQGDTALMRVVVGGGAKVVNVDTGTVFSGKLEC